MNTVKKTLLFVTTNTGKFEEVQRWVNQLDPTIALEQASLDIPEPQSLDIHTVALAKAQEAWKLLKKPLLIDDGGIYIEKYNKFPGTLAKYVFEGLGLEGIWTLAKEDPRAYFLSCLTYLENPCSYEFFEGRCYGKLIKPEHEVKSKHLPYTEIFIPNESTKTLAVLRGTEEEKACHHRFKALQKLLTWLQEHKINYDVN